MWWVYDDVRRPTTASWSIWRFLTCLESIASRNPVGIITANQCEVARVTSYRHIAEHRAYYVRRCRMLLTCYCCCHARRYLTWCVMMMMMPVILYAGHKIQFWNNQRSTLHNVRHSVNIYSSWKNWILCVNGHNDVQKAANIKIIMLQGCIHSTLELVLLPCSVKHATLFVRATFVTKIRRTASRIIFNEQWVRFNILNIPTIGRIFWK